MSWDEVAAGLFGFMALGIAGWVARSISNMSESVEQLNIKIAVLLTRIDSHESRISKLEDKE